MRVSRVRAPGRRPATARGRGVVVADVGADIGTYSVTIGNALAGVRIHAFEPSSSSVTVLRRNLQVNGLSERVEVHPVALGDGSTTRASLAFDVLEPGSSGLNASAGTSRQGRTQLQQVVVSTLDAELAAETEVDLLVVKMDVEGYERMVLEGAAITMERARETWLLVEDFVDSSIIEYLRAHSWVQTAKRTPYNSFWRRDRPAGRHGPVFPAAEVGRQVGGGRPIAQSPPGAS
jgi:FkbM family methyltransferase